MRIAQRTQDRLVLTDGSGFIRVLGALWLVVAVWVYGTDLRFATQMWAISRLIGFVIVGVSMIVLPTRVTAVFDRAKQILTITRGLPLLQTRVEIAFAAIADIDTETIVVTPRKPWLGVTEYTFIRYRIRVFLRDNTVALLVPYFILDDPDEPARGAAARDFLTSCGWSPAPTDRGLDVWARSTPANAPVPFLLVVAVVCVAALAADAYSMRSEHVAGVAALPAPGRVLSSRILIEDQRPGGRVFRPSVTVRYLLGDSAYSTDRVSLTDEDGDFTWASSVVAAHPNGQAVTVWYDQAHPGSAFLVRPTQSRTGVIWFVVLVAVLILSVRAGHFMPRWKPRNIA